MNEWATFFVFSHILWIFKEWIITDIKACDICVEGAQSVSQSVSLSVSQSVGSITAWFPETCQQAQSHSEKSPSSWWWRGVCVMCRMTVLTTMRCLEYLSHLSDLNPNQYAARVKIVFHCCQLHWGKKIQNNSFSAVQTLSPDTLTASHDNITVILAGAYEIHHNKAP